MPTLFGKDVRELLTPPHVKTMLHRERMRADRTDQPMSLVVFEAARQTPRCVRRLTQALLGGCRETDEVGWFDLRRPCAILPATPPGGAECFARRISEQARAVPSTRFSIYTYPESEPPDGPGRSDRGDWDRPNGPDWLGGGRGRRRPASECSMGGGEHLAAVAVLEATEVASEWLTPRQRALPVDALLCEPLPRWKRSMDVVGGAVGLSVFMPVMLLIAAAIKLTSRGPVLFKQRRAGVGSRPFTIYKFRTMAVDADAMKAQLRPLSEQDGPAFKMTHDPRVTLVGRFLRKTSLDELPQFWNVIKGVMSLVGPRPLPLDEAAGCLPWQQQRVLVVPGLTCIWQVRGRSQVTFDEWMRMDMQYIRNRSPLFDAWLLIRTFWAVALRRGAH
jgi:lipopolysaccharide/colanic/teichoic acid biosynthesis glycosyltransferase